MITISPIAPAGKGRRSSPTMAMEVLAIGVPRQTGPDAFGAISKAVTSTVHSVGP
jgi:hypothetical protein